MIWREYLNKFFPVNIKTQPGVLVIDDRRPSDGMVLCVVLIASSLFISALLFRQMIAYGFYWLLALFLLPALVFGIRSLLLPIRELYIFDKNNDTYLIRRWSALRRQTTQGSLSQIRAVQIERRLLSGGEHHGTREVFRVALLLHQGLLLGASDSLLLREDSALDFSYGSESYIASAIANFLELPSPETITI